MLFLRGEKMKITGSMNYVKFDLENGYIIKAEVQESMSENTVQIIFE